MVGQLGERHNGFLQDGLFRVYSFSAGAMQANILLESQQGRKLRRADIEAAVFPSSKS
jgi:hypothetical protein